MTSESLVGFRNGSVKAEPNQFSAPPVEPWSGVKTTSIPGLNCTKISRSLFAVEFGRLATDHKCSEIASAVCRNTCEIIIYKLQEPDFHEPLVHVMKSTAQSTQRAASVFVLFTPVQWVKAMD